ncbi:ribosomal protein L11 methyltransferase [Desulfatibacillum alkenivorans DSM 16219]|jgi:ribosomal protein L11 methyltransferase|uniref:Ribosomal protein L11 methyltransferase n=1 Tax=Desulfatibacillum alkenivorans DSM 16219 TaxID=1121393 RepID=A0A1M6GHF5_9BACT|nr:50S ribosomal protein L11 methyltransferase [Desulfatibacillum alkenivorans]SHJ09376.1 ribosomal protein L11 methyltransferase [Desulfatibacillum alkenivorans DSM 16219]
MQWMEIKIVFEAAEPELAQEMVSYLVMEHGAEGLEMTTPGETGMVQDGSGSSIPDSKEHSVTAFLPLDDLFEGRKADLTGALEDLKGSVLTDFSVSFSEQDDQPWETAWKAHFHPIEIGKSLVIKPSWEDYENPEKRMLIELDPGMAFGTGTHPTTAVCLEMIETECLKKAPERFLDVGTGSGILMIGAYKLGARKVYGCDNDMDALEAAAKNLTCNRVPDSDFGLWLGDLLAGIVEGAFDMVAANITAEANVMLIPGLPQIMAPGSIFIASGIMAEKKDLVLEALDACRFSVERVQETGGWVGIAARMP